MSGDGLTASAISCEYRWRDWRFMLTNADAPDLLRVSTRGIERLGAFTHYQAGENAFWDLVTSTIQDADHHLVDMRTHTAVAAIVSDRAGRPQSHLAVRVYAGWHFAHRYDTPHAALCSWTEIAAELSLFSPPP